MKYHQTVSYLLRVIHLLRQSIIFKQTYVPLYVSIPGGHVASTGCSDVSAHYMLRYKHTHQY